MWETLKAPLAYTAVGQSIGNVISVGQKDRQQKISDFLKKEQFMNKMAVLEAHSSLDKIKFDENSIPIGNGGEELCIDQDKLIYFCDNQFNIFDLTNQLFKTLYFEETSNNSALLTIAIRAMIAVSQSVFLSSEQKDKLHNAIKNYSSLVWENNGDINWVTALFRMFGKDYTYEELEHLRKDNQAGEHKKTHNGIMDNIRYFFGSRHRDKDRYFSIAEAFDVLRQELEISLKEIKLKLQQIKDKCIQELRDVNVFKEKRKSDFLTKVTKSKALLQRLYLAYKNNGENFDRALFHVACELYRRNELVKSRLYLSNSENNAIRQIERQNIQHFSDEEVMEQVERYFNFDENSARFLKTDSLEIRLDKYSKTIEIQDKFNGVYYLDFNKLSNDVQCGNNSKNCAIMYYKMLLTTLQKLSDNALYILYSPKNAKIMQYIEETIAKMENKSLKDDECEYLPNMLFHWISSLTNQPLLQKDVNKKIITVTFMNKDHKGKASDNTGDKDEDIDNFQNIAFDIFDPKTEQMKMGTIIKKGEKIYYKEDPGIAEFKVISAEELLMKLDAKSLQNEDIEKHYIGDCWPMRKMLYCIQKMKDKEQQKKAKAEKNVKLSMSCVSDDLSSGRNEYSQTRVNTGEGIELLNIPEKNISNSKPINALTDQSAVVCDNRNNMFAHHNNEKSPKFVCNDRNDISYKTSSINLNVNNDTLSKNV